MDGELENSIVVDSTTTVEPTNHIVKQLCRRCAGVPPDVPAGTTNAPASYKKVLTRKATGYYSKTGKGSSGLGLGYGTVAVDPDVIPYAPSCTSPPPTADSCMAMPSPPTTASPCGTREILVDLFYETYAESVLNGAIQVNVYVVG